MPCSVVVINFRIRVNARSLLSMYIFIYHSFFHHKILKKHNAYLIKINSCMAIIAMRIVHVVNSNNNDKNKTSNNVV